MFLTAKYVADKLNESSREITSASLVAKVLRGLSTSPTFPYMLMPARKRLNQLDMDVSQQYSMSSGITNNLSALPGYAVEDK